MAERRDESAGMAPGAGDRRLRKTTPSQRRQAVSGLTLPRHLQKYIVDQDERQYTPVDHAVWRFVLRQLRSFLSVHGHESYLQGLESTGIEIERIPRIADISEKLARFGWRATPV